ncbi:fructokinase [Planococcus sp. PAMC 21323]|uniref:carbohydrate kinase family protein n=1 Tax=Planococcus sp. PAMC 21323 TaxID=1526927 RepID=UPI000570B95D|nr:carbohydrate kinase [Planococcus sp. PAMC 21323]AIY06599.1 fructokinase [Planococcus sp. PAMC 21323]
MKNKKYVLTYGDAFVDYIAADTTNKSFNRHLGGATVNVAAGISRLGVPSSFVTITGEDETSTFVRNELLSEGVDLTHAIMIPEKRVSGVYIHLTPEFDRVFASYVNETPDLQVTGVQLSTESFEQACAFHFCSGTLFHPEARATTQKAIELAKEHRVICSYDVNIRPLRWESEEYCRETVMKFLPVADIIKLTTEELAFLMKTESLEEGIERLSGNAIPLVFVTDGENGTYAVFQGQTIHVPVVPVQPVDTTGAGDAFMAGILRHVYLYGLPTTQQEVMECANFGNQMGALCATKAGALTAMPRIEELNKNRNKGREM